MRGPKFTLGALRPRTPPSGKMFIPDKSTWPRRNVFKISTFQLKEFPKYEGVPNLHQGCYLAISKCVQNFQVSSSSSFRDMRGSQIYTRGRWAPAEKNSYLKRVLGSVEMCVEFQLCSSSSFGDMRGSRIYTRERCAPRTLPSGKFSYLKRVLGFI